MSVESLDDLLEWLESNNIPYDIKWPSPQEPEFKVIFKATMTDNRQCYGVKAESEPLSPINKE